MSERLTDNPSLFRLRVRYGKRDRLKYLGHLEVIHTDGVPNGCVLSARRDYQGICGFSVEKRGCFRGPN